jgi:hypothetical protein
MGDASVPTTRPHRSRPYTGLESSDGTSTEGDASAPTPRLLHTRPLYHLERKRIR